MKLKRLIFLGLLSMSLLSKANAFTYQDGDLLLVFRKDGFDDVLFNIGSISNFTAVAGGQTRTITNWNPQLVNTAYGTDWSDGVKYLLLATTPLNDANRKAWVTSGEPATKPTDRTASQWQGLWSKINAVGSRASQVTQTNSETSFVTASSAFHSYSFVVSNGGIQQSQIPKLGGSSAFTVENSTLSDLPVFEVKPSTSLPKPEANLLGTFRLASDHTLSFQAAGGSVVITATQVRTINVNGGTATITFDTLPGLKYRLLRANAIPATAGGWNAGTEFISGSGEIATLTDTIDEAPRFYVIETFQ